MPRYVAGTVYQEDVWTDIVSGATAVAGGYLLGTWAKATGKALWPAITGAAMGAGGTVLKHVAQGRPYLHESIEALGNGGLWGTGMVLASSTTTIGNVPAGAIPLNIATPPATTTAAARALAARQAAARAAAARAAAALNPYGAPAIPQLQPNNPNPSYPLISPYGGYEADMAVGA